MGASKKKDSHDKSTKRRPALSEESRENQLIALAVDLTEKRLREGKASPSEIVHYLRMGSQKERLARKKDEEEIKLLQAKTEAIQSSKHVEELYANAIKAMSIYSGKGCDEE